MRLGQARWHAWRRPARRPPCLRLAACLPSTRPGSCPRFAAPIPHPDSPVPPLCRQRAQYERISNCLSTDAWVRIPYWKPARRINIDFIRIWWVGALATIAVIIAGSVLLATQGVRHGGRNGEGWGWGTWGLQSCQNLHPGCLQRAAEHACMPGVTPTPATRRAAQLGCGLHRRHQCGHGHPSTLRYALAHRAGCDAMPELAAWAHRLGASPHPTPSHPTSTASATQPADYTCADVTKYAERRSNATVSRCSIADQVCQPRRLGSSGHGGAAACRP